jgi:CRISPR-associated protein Cmr4
MPSFLTFVHALSPLHAGTGQGVDLIDLPVARERATNLPFLPGSSLKGALRDLVREKELQTALFGPATKDIDGVNDHAGSLQLADQRLLLLPVRSMAGTFAWATCPFVLRRLRRDALDVGLAELPEVPQVAKHADALIAEKSALTIGDQIVLEDLDLTPQRETVVAAWAAWIGQHIFDDVWQTLLRERLCIVHDEAFNFLAETATEVSARIRLKDDSKTVAGGALWYEEALPTESVLYGMAVLQFTSKAREKADPARAQATLVAALKQPLQLGGKASTGKGICRVAIVGLEVQP